MVRKKVTAEMRAHPERYAPFIAGCMISIKRAAESELDAELINEEAYEKYVKDHWSRSTRRSTTRCGLRCAPCTRTQSLCS